MTIVTISNLPIHVGDFMSLSPKEITPVHDMNDSDLEDFSFEDSFDDVFAFENTSQNDEPTPPFIETHTNTHDENKKDEVYSFENLDSSIDNLNLLHSSEAPTHLLDNEGVALNDMELGSIAITELDTPSNKVEEVDNPSNTLSQTDTSFQEDSLNLEKWDEGLNETSNEQEENYEFQEAKEPAFNDTNIALSTHELDNILEDTTKDETQIDEIDNIYEEAQDEAVQIIEPMDFAEGDIQVLPEPENLVSEDDDISVLTLAEEGEKIAELAPPSQEFLEDGSENLSLISKKDDIEPVALSNSELNEIVNDMINIEHLGVESSEHHLMELPHIEHSMPNVEAPPELKETSDFHREELIDNMSKENNLDKQDLKKMISYLDMLFDKLPEDTIREFSNSEYFDLYKKIMTELGIYSQNQLN